MEDGQLGARERQSGWRSKGPGSSSAAKLRPGRADRGGWSGQARCWKAPAFTHVDKGMWEHARLRCRT